MPPNLKSGISLVRQAIKLLETLPDEKIEMLESGQATLELRVNPKSRAKDDQAAEDEQMPFVRSKLESATSRDEGTAFLRETMPSKAKLQRFARTLDLNYQKDDSMDRLIEKIVEATIGYKLRSQAITGSSDQLLSRE